MYLNLAKLKDMKHSPVSKGFFILFLLLMIFHPVSLFPQQNAFSLNRYLLPPVFDGRFPNDTITKISLPENPCILQQKPLASELNLSFSLLTPEQEFIEQMRKRAYRNFLRHNIASIKYVSNDFSGEVERLEQIRPNISPNLLSVEPDYKTGNINPNRYVPKRKYWIFGWNSLLQFSQSYISKNWYNGGTGNQNLLNVQRVTFNYKKDKIQFNNLIDWKLSFNTNSNDTLRSFFLGEDLVRTYSDFGLKAFKDKFYYSSNLEIRTKLFRGYRENSLVYTSALFSPLQINMGLFGIKYQLSKTSPKDKYKKINLSADLSPLSTQFTWVFDSEVLAQNRYGIPIDKKFLLDVGSTLNAKIMVNINRQILFNSRVKYFTNYKKVIFEMENELTMSLNRYFSTRLYLYGRFDDTSSIKRDDRLGYVQINELLSFGFNYTW